MSIPRRLQAGFTLVELLVVMSLIGILATTTTIIFINYVKLYSSFQSDGGNFTEIALQSERIANVMRGLTDITSVGGDDITAYAYFAPADTYTSQVRYYVSADKKSVMVDVTRMTSNPPVGVTIPSTLKTYKIISNYQPVAGTSLFTYYDSGNNVLVPPIANEHTIIAVQINLVADASKSATGQQLTTKVSLRNRKVNL